MPKTFYITTAIYYTNSSPHVGHAYEMVLTDVIARYHRLKGEKVFFLTGVDQHGQKVQQSAAKAAVPALIEAPSEMSADYLKELSAEVYRVVDLPAGVTKAPELAVKSARCGSSGLRYRLGS